MRSKELNNLQSALFQIYYSAVSMSDLLPSVPEHLCSMSQLLPCVPEHYCVLCQT